MNKFQIFISFQKILSNKLNNLFHFSCLTLSISAVVLGQGFDQSVIQKLQDLSKKINRAISQECLISKNSEQIACNKKIHDKYGNVVEKTIQDMNIAGQNGDLKKVAELSKQVIEPLCCKIWQSKSCLIVAVKVGFPNTILIIKLCYFYHQQKCN